MAKRVSKGKGDPETPVRTTFTTSRLPQLPTATQVQVQAVPSEFDLWSVDRLDGQQ